MGDGSDPMWPMAMLSFRWFNFVAYSGQILTVIDRYQRHFCTQTPQQGHAVRSCTKGTCGFRI